MQIRTLLLQLGAAAAVVQLAMSATVVPATAQACTPGKCIRVGSYNIQHFADTLPPSVGQANSSTEIEQLAVRIADQANLDVVVLQEINKNGDNWKGANGLFARLQSRGYERAIEGSFGGHVEPGQVPERPQYVIVLYRTSSIALVSGSTDAVPIPTTFDEGPTCRYKSVRPPVAAVLKSTTGNLTFRIVGVHLKSQSRVDGDPTGQCDNRIRTVQAAKIAAYLDGLKADNIPAVIVGDFNAPFNRPEFQALRNAGYETLIKTDCPAKPEQCSYHGFGGPELIDHVVVHASMKEAVKDGGAVAQVGNLQTYKETQSDHLPIWASFRTDM